MVVLKFGGRFFDRSRPVVALSRVLTPPAASAAIADMAPPERSDARALGEGVNGAVGTRSFKSELERTEHLRALVRAHYSNIWRFLRRLGFEEHLADDAAQELFLVAVRRIDGVRPESERAFLYSTALRIATALKRKQAREVSVDPLETHSAIVETAAATLDERLDDERARELLYRLLSELDERFRIVFVMYELEELTMPEIAAALEIPLGTATSRLRTAREDFRARLARHRMRTRREEAT
ncbi:MAG: hypothetical protein K0S65_2316 [Labilithrix sp.]|nr:hypothetical protein [Labilithrix sp.]